MAKCLSLKQPYAELILSGRKTIELRKWNTKFRGQVLIHASKAINSEACKLYNIDVSSLITRAIVGSALLHDVKLYQRRKEFIADQSKHFAVSTYPEHMIGFLLSDAKRFDKPIPLKGQLGFFDPAKRGWNVMPTSRNAKGVDIILYNRDASRRHTIQVNTLTNKVPVPLGMGLDSLQMNDYLIVRTVYANQPEVFIAKPAEITNKIHKGINERGQISYWFERKEYERFAGRWEIIRVDGIVLEASSSNDSLTNAE